MAQQELANPDRWPAHVVASPRTRLMELERQLPRRASIDFLDRIARPRLRPYAVSSAATQNQ